MNPTLSTQHRANRLSGQAAGIAGMLKRGQPPRAIVQQLGALRAAARELGLSIIQDAICDANSTPTDLLAMMRQFM
jgi:DNA-binding FrmR family transcriptional regulator